MLILTALHKWLTFLICGNFYISACVGIVIVFKIKCLNFGGKKSGSDEFICDFYCCASWREGNVLVFGLVTGYTFIFVSKPEIFCPVPE